MRLNFYAIIKLFMCLMKLYHIGFLTLDILLHPLQLNFYATIKSFSFISENCVALDAFQSTKDFCMISHDHEWNILQMWSFSCFIENFRSRNSNLYTASKFSFFNIHVSRCCFYISSRLNHDIKINWKFSVEDEIAKNNACYFSMWLWY